MYAFLCAEFLNMSEVFIKMFRVSRLVFHSSDVRNGVRYSIVYRVHNHFIWGVKWIIRAKVQHGNSGKNVARTKVKMMGSKQLNEKRKNLTRKVKKTLSMGNNVSETSYRMVCENIGWSNVDRHWQRTRSVRKSKCQIRFPPMAVNRTPNAHHHLRHVLLRACRCEATETVLENIIFLGKLSAEHRRCRVW